MIADLEAAKPSLGKDANIVASTPKRDKFKSYRDLGFAQHLLFESDAKTKTGNIHRTRLCHAARAFNAESIKLNISADASKENASLSGVQTCGSVWACPVCAKRIATKRGKEVSKAIDFMEKTGHIPLMFTNTASHKKGDSLKEFKAKFKQAHRYFVQHRRWRDLKAVLGVEHSIKAVEITNIMRNGWHYHQHTIIFAKADEINQITDNGISVWVEMCRDLWLDALKRVGLYGDRERAFDVRMDGAVKHDYIAKLGLEDDDTSNLDYELTAGHNKQGGGLKIWGILERARLGIEGYAELYTEYVDAMTGDNWITWSHGLKELCGVDELDDEQAAADAESQETNESLRLLEMSDDEFLPVRKMHAVADLLAFAAITRNENLVRDWLRALATEWNNSGAGAERDRLLAQYKAMNDKWENWRKSLIKNQGWTELPEAFTELYNQKEQLRKRLELK